MKNISRISALCGASLLAGVLHTAQAQTAASISKVELCIGCHGIANYKATYPEVYRVPKISGQNAKYIEAALNGYRSGERRHPSMRGIAGSWSDQDIAAIAAYYSAHK